MEIELQAAQPADLPFLEEMLYEAVFWRMAGNGPALEDGLAYPEVRRSLAEWGERAGDTAVVAMVDSLPAGAAWFRRWNDETHINGYIEATMPVLVIGVRREYRRLGIGRRMIEWLVARAAEQGVEAISLSVAKDNRALRLYRQQGFEKVADSGEMLLLVRRIESWR